MMPRPSDNPTARHAVAGWPDRALTLRNPWPAAILRLGKRIENRGWKPPAGVTSFWLHAGAGVDEGAIPAIIAMGIDRLSAWELAENMVRSAIVALVELGSVCTAEQDGGGCDCGRWAMPGQAHWRLTTVRPLTRPVPASGGLGLWRPSVEIIAKAWTEVQP